MSGWPKFVAASAVGRWNHPEGRLQVFLLKRTDGAWSYSTEMWVEDEFAKCWTPGPEHGGLYGSEAIAKNEIHAQFPWTSSVEMERRET